MAAPVRLVEVWAAAGSGAGKSGSGWVLNNQGVLTAYHIIEPFLQAQQGSGENHRSPDHAMCQARLGTTTGLSDWLDLDVLWSDPTLDVALLRACDAETPEWLSNVFSVAMQGSALRLARIGDRVAECEAIGFPDANTRSDGIRQSEQPQGILMPAGGIRDARGRVPFDITTSVPESAPMWQGMSGAAVRDNLGRLVGMVVAVHPQRQLRRLLVLPIEELVPNEGFIAATGNLGWTFVLEDFISVAPTITRDRRIALLRWIIEMPDQMDNCTNALREVVFSLPDDKEGKAERKRQVERLRKKNYMRHLVDRFTEMERLLPKLFVSVDPTPDQQGQFSELFPALRREYENWFWAMEAVETAMATGSYAFQDGGTSVLVPGFEMVSGSDGSTIRSVPPQVFHRDDIEQYEDIFRSATELLVYLFPIDEQQEAAR